ncbi:MAG: mechanosensitive ion channel [Microscillaceae bacterium]|nr:mechanosensitive ion channel [Microscillaceae bacterium]
MTHHYFLIFFGFYGILILLLVLVWQFMRRLRLPRRSVSILYVLAMLLCFVGMGYIRAPWFNLFEQADLINKRGELVTALRTFEIEKPGKKNIKIEAGDLVQASDIAYLRQSGQLKKLVKELGAENTVLRVIKVREQINLIFKSLPILLVAYLINSLLGFFLWHGLWLDEDGEPLVPAILRQMSAVLIYLISITIVIAILAPSLLSGFLTTLGTSGAIAAFLGQEPIKQAFTALSLNINKNIRKGDRVEVMGHSGIVREIGWKSIKLTTIDHNLLTIPNTLLVNNIHTNYSKPDRESLTKILVTVREQAPRIR